MNKVLNTGNVLISIINSCSVRVKEEVMEGVGTFLSRRVDFTANGRIDAELNHRSMKVIKRAVMFKDICKNRNALMETKKSIVYMKECMVVW